MPAGPRPTSADAEVAGPVPDTRATCREAGSTEGIVGSWKRLSSSRRPDPPPGLIAMARLITAASSSITVMRAEA